jgi:alkylation response protein AidB-like acyl-CoA dehydrogenase
VDAEALDLIRETFRRVLTETEPAGLPGALHELGFRELAADDPAAAIGTLFEEQGRAGVASPALDLVVLEALGVADPSVTAVVYPALAAGAEPAAVDLGGQLRVDGMLLSGAERATDLLVAVRGAEDDPSIAHLGSAETLDRSAIAGFDPDLGLVAIRGAVDPVGPSAARDGWAGAVGAARRALTHELVGVCEAMLATAVDHVIHREQFGRPIATFQAVKHRLADVHTAVTATRTALDVAWRDDDAFLAAVAKAQAGRAFGLAARHCPQVCGGIGFTWEFGLHRFVRRGSLLDSFLGSGEALQSEIGRTLLATRSVPRLGGL